MGMVLSPDHERRIRDSAHAFADAIIAVLRELPDPDDGFERLLSVEEAGARLGGLARSTMWAAIASGRIKSIRPAGTKRRLIPASEVERIARGGGQP